jgi:sugar lactone lactonase YvrE
MQRSVRTLCAVLLLGSPLTSVCQWVAETPDALNAAALKAYQAKDYAGFLYFEKRALELAPSTPRFIYNVACGEALQGNTPEAIRRLDQLLARKLDLGASSDDDFAKIRKTPAWSEFESRLAILRQPLVRSEVAFTLADPALVATGIAIDQKTGDTYLASVRQRKIVRRTKAGAVSDFIAEGKDGFLAGASLAIDSERHILYATTSAVSFMKGFRKDDDGQTGIFAFDLRSGKLVRKVTLVADRKPHFLNALALRRDGTVYISDSGTPGIYCLALEAAALEPIIAPDLFRSTQGLAFSADEKTLYVADYTDGLWALDLASKIRKHLEGPPDVWLGGMDGLSPVPDGFLTVQIGVRPERVLHLRLDPRRQRIASVDILEMNHPGYSGPIQGVVTGDEFLYIANSQLALGNAETGVFQADRARPTLVLKLPIKF